MNYWHMQLHPDDQNWGKEKELLQTLGLIGLGEWDEKRNQQDFFENKMKIGDIVAIKRASNLIALVEVTGEYEYADKPGKLDWFERRRKVKVLDWYNPEYNYYVSPRGTLTRCNTDNEDAETNISITRWYNNIIGKILMTETKNVLLYKHQIILQGPPGTGKTRLAKIIAEDLIKPNTVGNPIAIINNFFSTFDPNNEQRKTDKTNRDKLLKQFQQKFPIDSLNEMTLDDYCAGKGDRNNFCWWIETGLKSLGKYSPGSARSYLIYWSKDEEDYKKYGKLVKDIDSDNEAMQKIAELLQQVVKAKNPDSAMEYYGDSFLLKILNSYFPDEFFPINGREALDNTLKLFGVNSINLTKFEKNKKLNELCKSKNEEFKKDVDAFEFMRFLFDNFNLKTGEDIDTNQTVISKGEYQLIQFHPAYSYEDFVRGIVASTGDKGIEYKTENKILAEFAQKAKDNPNANYVLIIDEINRANLPAVLGELIYALEYRGEEVTSMYKYENEHEIILPKNLYIIGTMNTADRSVGHIDYAIRRRFAFVDVLPDEAIIISDTAKTLFQSVKAIFTTHTSPDFKINDVLIGHSYFLTDDDAKLQMKLLYEIKPILKEYLKDGVLLETAKSEIDNLNV